MQFTVLEQGSEMDGVNLDLVHLLARECKPLVLKVDSIPHVLVAICYMEVRLGSLKGMCDRAMEEWCKNG